MIIGNNNQAESGMLQESERDAGGGDRGGQGSATEAGQCPQEAKQPQEATSKAHVQISAKEQFESSAAEEEAETLTGSKTGDGNQQPTSVDSRENHAASAADADNLKAEATSRLAAEAPAEGAASALLTIAPAIPAESMSQRVLVSGDSSVINQAPPTSATLDSSSERTTTIPAEKATTGLVAASMASPPSGLLSSGAELPLLALGQQAAAIDGRSQITQHLAPQTNHNHASSSKLSIPAVAPTVSKSKAGTALRRGKWTVEEESYVARVIQDFNSGFLNAPAGTTLRSYLSEKLQCDPMRITKKFTGDSCIGKRVFHPAVRNPSNAAAIDKAQAELDSLERRWRRRLEMQQRESAKKAAASAAAAAAATGRSHGFVTQGSVGTLGGAAIGHNGAVLGGQNPASANGVAQTASWLDRASNILKTTGSQTGVSVPCSHQKFSLTQEQAQALQSLPKKEIEMQMKEVERLIHEGPIIQQTTAGLPLMLHQSSSDASRQPSPASASVVARANSGSSSDGQRTPPEPADKRMKTGAEDAEALVGFLTAVRASAAAGTDSFSS